MEALDLLPPTGDIKPFKVLQNETETDLTLQRIQYFQGLSRSHFAICRLERRHDQGGIEAKYQKLKAVRRNRWASLVPLPLSKRNGYEMVILVLAIWSNTHLKAKADANLDQRVRWIVDGIMQEKDAEIANLKARVQELEAQLRQMPKTPAALPIKEPPPQEFPAMRAPTAKAEMPQPAAAQQTSEEREQTDRAGLIFNGFFDTSAKTKHPERRPFDFGSIELDIEFTHFEHFAGSGAFVWNGETAEAPVALIDYHQFDRRVPPRGRIFLEPGFHLQVGRFDLPYALDYQFFAARDRLTITPPLTTERIQQGGYNSEGIRTYGRWGTFDYSVFWTNPVYGNTGSALGGRLGKNFGRYPFRMAGIRPDLVGTGFSFLVDWDGMSNARN